jgi:hypothetical protein
MAMSAMRMARQYSGRLDAAKRDYLEDRIAIRVSTIARTEPVVFSAPAMFQL